MVDELGRPRVSCRRLRRREVVLPVRVQEVVQESEVAGDRAAREWGLPDTIHAIGATCGTRPGTVTC